MERAQSAMEYLMTYGWAILIIAVVLAAMFALGVFNQSSLGIRASPNSCRVFRPSGPGTTVNLNLQGVCTSLPPQYVAMFSGSGSVTATMSGLPSGASQRTMTGWFYSLRGVAGVDGVFGYGTLSTHQLFELDEGINATRCGGSSKYTIGDTYGTPFICSTQAPISVSTWYFAAMVYDGANVISYVGYGGSLSSAQNAIALNTAGTQFYIGNGQDVGRPFTGGLSNVQLYSTALSQNDISALYQEGIGGVPLNLRNLVGWWPLNGDANDYSGNGYNGATSNMIFTSSWSN